LAVEFGMNVRTLCLAILNFGEATGYEIKKLSVEGKYSYFVDASFGSIYPALSRLEADGLVTSRQEIQPGKPPRKIYAITEAGRSELAAALSESPSRDVFRSEFLLIALCAEILPRHVVTKAIEDRFAILHEELDRLKQIVAECEDDASRWAAEYGVTCTTCSLAYLTRTRAELEAIAGRNVLDTDAAAE